MYRRIVTIIEECDGDCCSHAHTHNANGADNRLPDPKGGQLDDKVLGAQGGAQESVNSPEKQGATEPVVKQRADIVTTSPSSTVDVTIQPQEVRSSRLASVKAWLGNLSKPLYTESVKYIIPLVVKDTPGWLHGLWEWFRNWF